MLNLRQIVIDSFADELKRAYTETYGLYKPELGNVTAWVGRLALECIANTDNLYHDIEHTIMVCLAGQSILKGRQIADGGVTPEDWMHFMIAVACHDIGYRKGICGADRDGVYATGVGDGMVEIASGGTDAALTAYHVDRGQLFVRERFGNHPFIDAELVAECIEATRFPVPEGTAHKHPTDLAQLTRAADFIGQLGDPDYLRKLPGLFYEFEEVGTNARLGYACPDDLRRGYAGFFWNVVHVYLEEALRYLALTQDGKQWIANLHAQVFAVEHQDR